MKWLLLLPLIAWGSEVQIRSLNNSKTFNYGDIMKPKSIAIIFQQGCSSCRILMRDLKCLEKEYNIVALGAFSSEKSLRLEALKYHADYRSFYADKEVLTKLGVTSQATPQVFIFGEKKVLNFTGRKTCEETYKMAKTNSK